MALTMQRCFNEVLTNSYSCFINSAVTSIFTFLMQPPFKNQTPLYASAHRVKKKIGDNFQC